MASNWCTSRTSWNTNVPLFLASKKCLFYFFSIVWTIFRRTCVYSLGNSGLEIIYVFVLNDRAYMRHGFF